MGRSYTLARDMGQGFFKDIGILIFGLIQFFGKPHDYTSLYFEKKIVYPSNISNSSLTPNTPKKDHFSLKRMIRST